MYSFSKSYNPQQYNDLAYIHQFIIHTMLKEYPHAHSLWASSVYDIHIHFHHSPCSLSLHVAVNLFCLLLKLSSLCHTCVMVFPSSAECLDQRRCYTSFLNLWDFFWALFWYSTILKVNAANWNFNVPTK